MSREMFGSMIDELKTRGWEIKHQDSDCYEIEKESSPYVYCYKYISKISKNITKKLDESALVYRLDRKKENNIIETTYYLETESGYMCSLEIKEGSVDIYKNLIGEKVIDGSITEIFREHLTDINELRLKLVAGTTKVIIR